MAEYTLNPIPVYKVQQINTQEDADAWVESLTENELISGSRTFTNVRVEVREDTGTIWLRYTENSEIGSESVNLDTDIGGYALANTDNSVIRLWIEGVENFTRRYQPWPLPLEPEV